MILFLIFYTEEQHHKPLSTYIRQHWCHIDSTTPKYDIESMPTKDLEVQFLSLFLYFIIVRPKRFDYESNESVAKCWVSVENILNPQGHLNLGYWHTSWLTYSCHESSIDSTVGAAWCCCGGLCGVSSSVVGCWAHVPATLFSSQLHEWIHGAYTWELWGTHFLAPNKPIDKILFRRIQCFHKTLSKCWLRTPGNCISVDRPQIQRSSHSWKNIDIFTTILELGSRRNKTTRSAVLGCVKQWNRHWCSDLFVVLIFVGESRGLHPRRS